MSKSMDGAIRRPAIALGLFAACLAAPAAYAQADPVFPPSALSPSNLAKPRPKPPFNLTGTWVDADDALGGSFGPPFPRFKPEVLEVYKQYQDAHAKHQAFGDDTASCYPSGMPMIMTRIWPFAVVQIPTAIYLVSNSANSFRTVFLDGRRHTDPDVVLRTANGDSIGYWEGDALVIDTNSFTADHHWVQGGIPISDQFHLVERIRLNPDGKTFTDENIMTDPKGWDGEWRVTKTFARQDDVDVTEAECNIDFNKNLPGYEK